MIVGVLDARIITLKDVIAHRPHSSSPSYCDCLTGASVRTPYAPGLGLCNAHALLMLTSR